MAPDQREKYERKGERRFLHVTLQFRLSGHAGLGPHTEKPDVGKGRGGRHPIRKMCFLLPTIHTMGSQPPPAFLQEVIKCLRDPEKARPHARLQLMSGFVVCF